MSAAPTRQRVARVLLAVAGIAFLWTLLLVAIGGFDTSVFGVRVRTHNAWNPARACAIALALFVAVYGPGRVLAHAIAAGHAFDRWLTRVRLPYRWFAAALALAMAAFAWHWGVCVAGGSDSYGYLSQAQLWLHGVPIVSQPWTAIVPWPNAAWTFTPLGYRFIPGETTIVPTYAIGLPLLIAGVQSIVGYSWMFLIWPVAGALLVYVSYGLGRELGSPAAGLVAAWLTATNVTLLGEVTAPMSDVPLAAALAVTSYFLFKATGPAVIRAGLAAAVAVLVRPNMAPTVAMLALWLALRPGLGGSGSWGQALRRAVAFGVAASPGFLIVAAGNWKLFGSPFVSGYGTLDSVFHVRNLLPNLREYPALLIGSHAELVLAGMLALFVPLRWIWRGVSDRSVLAGAAIFVVSVVLQYLAFEPATNGGYLRYLLPCWPLIMVGVARLALLPARPGWRGLAVAMVVFWFGVRSLIAASNAGVLDVLSERKYAGAAAIVAAHTEPGSVVFTMQHSGSVRFYAGRMTIRYDVLEPDWLDRSVAWMAERGVHSYALLDDWEAEVFRKHFAGQARLAALAAPEFIYRGAVATHFYDLMATPPAGQPPVVVIDTFGGPHAVPPAKGPIEFTLKK